MSIKRWTIPITKKWLTISIYRTILYCLWKYIYNWENISPCTTNSTRLSTPFRAKRAQNLIRKLGTAYNVNTWIKEVGNNNSNLIVINFFVTNQSYNGSHDRRNYHRSKIKQAMLFSDSFPFDDRSPFVHTKSVGYSLYSHHTLTP